MPSLKRYLPLAALGMVAAILLASGAARYLSLDALREHYAFLHGLARDDLVGSLLIFVGVFIVVTGVNFPGALILTLTGGLLFGIWLGAAATVIGETLGALVVFLVVRSSLGVALRERAERSDGRLKALMDGAGADAFGYVLTLRLLPVAPFWLVNLVAALANVPLRAYVLATFLGIIPATLIYSGVGAGIGHVIARGEAPNLGLLLDPLVIGPLIGLAALSLATTLVQRRRRQARNSQGPG